MILSIYLIFFGFMSSSKNSPFKGGRSSDLLFGGHIKAPWGLLSFGNSQISNISWSLTSFHPSFGSLKRWVFGLGKKNIFLHFVFGMYTYLVRDLVCYPNSAFEFKDLPALNPIFRLIRWPMTIPKYLPTRKSNFRHMIPPHYMRLSV